MSPPPACSLCSGPFQVSLLCHGPQLSSQDIMDSGPSGLGAQGQQKSTGQRVSRTDGHPPRCLETARALVEKLWEEGRWRGIVTEPTLGRDDSTPCTYTFVLQGDLGTDRVPGSSHGCCQTRNTGAGLRQKQQNQESFCEPPVTFNPEMNQSLNQMWDERPHWKSPGYTSYACL